MELAPIVLFVFRRPRHTAQLLESLARCAEISASKLVVYCEGVKDQRDWADIAATRKLVRDFRSAATIDIIEHDANLGCAKSIISGISEVLASHDRIIVLEDDLVLSRHFLSFMNSALIRYAADDHVMHVSGYQYPINLEDQPTALSVPFINPWGWGTWKRAWQRFDRSYRYLDWADRFWWRRFRLDSLGAFELRKALAQAKANELDEWDISWSLTVFAHHGRAIFPRRSLVGTLGFDGSGTHEMNGEYWVDPQSVIDNVEDQLPDQTRPCNSDLAMFAARMKGGESVIRRSLNHLRGEWGWRYSLASLNGRQRN
ncbi:MAG: hypothetical protein AB7E72_05050 [Lysobacterales bacterium]